MSWKGFAFAAAIAALHPALTPAGDQAAPAAPAGPPSISASPNPVPHGTGAGTTTITWTTGDKSEGVVRVSTDGGIEQVFGKGATGSAEAPWIAANSIYEFRLYAIKSLTTVLASVRVERAQPPIAAVITADPNPVPPGTGFGTTTISWSTGDRSEGELFVAADGGTERLFTKGPSGSLKANWIDRAKTYDFRLYTASVPRRLLASVRLEATEKRETGSAPSPAGTIPVAAVIAAHPNPVPAGFGAGSTLVSWDVGYLGGGRVMVSVNGAPATEFAAGPRGARNATGIRTGSVYEYRLYSPKGDLLASMIVTRREVYPLLFWFALGAFLLLALAYIRRGRRAPSSARPAA